ncbi:hypothetical protein PO124_07135 [Bacillus licheniformis]|nr:hypothetical protein [Bacillus licheniformis]
MLSDTIDEELLKGAPHLKVVANLAVGYDNIDVEAAQSIASSAATRLAC